MILVEIGEGDGVEGQESGQAAAEQRCKALNASEAKRGKLKRTTERNELGRFPPPFRLRLFHSQPLSSSSLPHYFPPFCPPPPLPLLCHPAFRACGTLGCNAHYCTKLIKIKSCLLVIKNVVTSDAIKATRVNVIGTSHFFFFHFFLSRIMLHITLMY